MTIPLYFTANSIGALVNLIMGLVIVIFLWRIPQKSRPTWLLLAATGCSTLFVSFWFLTSVNSSIWAHWLIPPQFFFTLLAGGFWLQFAAQFPQNDHPRLTRFYGVYTAVSLFIAVGVIAYYYQQWFVYEAQRFLLMQIIGLMVLSHYFLQIITFGYKTIYLGRHAAEGQKPSVWRAFWRPANRTAKATRLFMFFIACLPLLSFLNILFSLGYVPSRVYYSTFMVGMMAVFTAFTLVYLNHTPDVTHLMDKLLLVSVILVLTVLGLMGRGTFTLLEERFAQGVWESLAHAQVVLTYGNTGAEGLDTAVSLPPGFRYLATYPANERTAEQFQPIFWADGVDPASVIPQITTRHPNDEQQNNRLEETQVGQLYIGDVDGYLYLNPPFPWQEHLVFITDWQGARLEMGLSYQTYRAIINEQAQLYVWAIVLIPLVVLWIFPRFFSQTLVRPLEALLQGVRRVNAGDLNTAVVVRNTDEIGYLTGSFNHMVRSLYEQNEQLEEYSRTLEDKVLERTINLKKAMADAEQARQAAEDANRAKSMFLANMSHELRTPLNAIIGYAELVTEEVADLGAEEVIPDLERISQSGQILLTLINDVLDLAKIESGRMELYYEEFKLSALLHELRVGIVPMVQKNGNELQMESDTAVDNLIIYLDYTKLRQILLNLLSNAAKFTHHGQIWLRATTDTTTPLPHLILEVEDSGIGMDESHISEIFQPFRQADASTTRQYGGTGLGLAITQHFCHMLGGQISVTSQPGIGSKFTIRLPLKTALPEPPEATS